MKIGIIDIGSNTMKAFVYEISEKKQKKIRIIDKQYIYAHLMSQIKQDKLTQEGLHDLLEAAKQLKNFTEEHHCEQIYAFATSAVRDAGNTQEIKQRFFDATQLQLDILSEDSEAYHDYVSLSFFSSQNCGVGVDLGGGSAQIVTYDEKGLCESVSMPLGALRMKNMFVGKEFPSQSEFNRIKMHVKESIINSKRITAAYYKRIHLIGGTATSLLLLMRASDQTRYFAKNVLRMTDMIQIKVTLEAMGSDLLPFLLKHAKGREYSVLPGLAVLQAMGEYFSCEEFKVMKCGVREGYLIEKVLKRQE